MEKLVVQQGKGKRVEAIQVNLTGEISNYYDVYYRVYSQSYGWLGWAKNGMKAGTEGLSKRLEAIEIKLVPKGQGEPCQCERCIQATSDSVFRPRSWWD